MSVLRLSDGGFAVFSPLAATPECVRLLLDLVKKERLKLSSAYLIAPSTYPEHHESLAVRFFFFTGRVWGCVVGIGARRFGGHIHVPGRTPDQPPTNTTTNNQYHHRPGARPSRRRAS